MKSATTLLLTLGSIAAAAAASDISEVSPTTAEIEGAPRVFHQPNTAEDEEHRDLLRSESSCFTLRFSGDSNTSTHNSFKLEDVSAGKVLMQRGVGQLKSNQLEDFPSAGEPCLKPTLGNKLKLTVTDADGDLDGFFAFFVGSLRVDRAEGQMGQEYVKCFKMISGGNGVEGLDLSECGVSSKTEFAAASMTGYVEVGKGNPSPSPPAPTPAWVSTLCPSGEKKIKVEFVGDKYIENSWSVRNKRTGSTVLQSKDYDSVCKSSNWQSCNRETVEKCLPVNEDYEVVFKDKIGDAPPVFKLHMEGRGGVFEELWGSALFGKQWTMDFHTGTVPMTQRDKQWLDSHNARR